MCSTNRTILNVDGMIGQQKECRSVGLAWQRCTISEPGPATMLEESISRDFIMAHGIDISHLQSLDFTMVRIGNRSISNLEDFFGLLNGTPTESLEPKSQTRR